MQYCYSSVFILLTILLELPSFTDGVCSGCLIHEEKDELDWNKRLEKLKKIVTPYKK